MSRISELSNYRNFEGKRAAFALSATDYKLVFDAMQLQPTGQFEKLTIDGIPVLAGRDPLHSYLLCDTPYGPVIHKL